MLLLALLEINLQVRPATKAIALILIKVTPGGRVHSGFLQLSNGATHGSHSHHT
jgi:hypothetical protein